MTKAHIWSRKWVKAMYILKIHVGIGINSEIISGRKNSETPTPFLGQFPASKQKDRGKDGEGEYDGRKRSRGILQRLSKTSFFDERDKTGKRATFEIGETKSRRHRNQSKYDQFLREKSLSLKL